MLKHHVFLVRNWEKIRQKQEEVKHSDSMHSSSLYTRWNGICRDDGNIKSGEATPAHKGLKTPCKSILGMSNLQRWYVFVLVC